ncbi:MAG: DUF4349 domain-containing protein [Bacteroidia bacterium]|nr:DUF4349 domain-containing protein [Bacteroidia bacterium]
MHNFLYDWCKGWSGSVPPTRYQIFSRYSIIHLFAGVLLVQCVPYSQEEKIKQQAATSSDPEVITSPRAESYTISPSKEREDISKINEKSTSKISAATLNPYSPKVIYTANLKLQVEDLKKIENLISALLKQQQGYISQQRYEQPTGRKSLFYILRVNAAAFDSVIQKLCSWATFIQHKSLEGNDVSREYYDIETRLASKKSALEQYKTILQRANTVKEILEVEDRLRVIQEEIEALQGQIRFYEHSIVYATIYVEFYKLEASSGLPENSFIYRIGKAFLKGWELLGDVIIGILHIWPLGIIAIFLYFLVRKKLSAKKK